MIESLIYILAFSVLMAVGCLFEHMMIALEPIRKK